MCSWLASSFLAWCASKLVRLEFLVIKLALVWKNRTTTDPPDASNSLSRCGWLRTSVTVVLIVPSCTRCRRSSISCCLIQAFSRCSLLSIWNAAVSTHLSLAGVSAV